MKHQNITLIIQGPVSIYTTFMLHRYCREHPMIVVIPKTIPKKSARIVNDIRRMMADPELEVSLFMYDEKIPEEIYNDQNRYYQFLSTQLGLTACKTEFVIKFRSDEFYSNITPLIEAVLTSDDKIVTNDVFFRNASVPYHPSDHIVGGSIRQMLTTFTLAREFCEDKELRENNVLIKQCRTTKTKFGANHLAAEQQLGCAAITLQYSPSKLEKVTVLDAMKERFIIIPSTKLGVFRIAFNSNAKDHPNEYIDETYFNEDMDVSDINNYE